MKQRGNCCRAFYMEKPLLWLVRACYIPAITKSNTDAAFKSIAIDNLKLASFAIPLPEDWEEWPEESKIACSKHYYQILGLPRYTCKMLTKSGKCGCYARRPYICREYVPNEFDCEGCGAWNNGRCMP
jgi:Fe-S-cluster containining protein